MRTHKRINFMRGIDEQMKNESNMFNSVNQSTLKMSRGEKIISQINRKKTNKITAISKYLSIITKHWYTQFHKTNTTGHKGTARSRYNNSE
jgi:hypothetical protein